MEKPKRISTHEDVNWLHERLRGLTVAGIEDEFEDDADWSDHGGIAIVFSDGSSLACHGWGYDAWGADLRFSHPADVPPNDTLAPEAPPRS